MENKKIDPEDIHIRTELLFADHELITYFHGAIYKSEYDYGIEFENYVAAGLNEFIRNYDPLNNRVWICEHHDKMVGCLVLENRGEAAQLRYFLIKPEFRGIGLGKKLMDMFVGFAVECGYSSVYLWTTNEQVKAADIYTKYGFSLIEEKESDAFGKSLIEQKYELRLK